MFLSFSCLADCPRIQYEADSTQPLHCTSGAGSFADDPLNFKCIENYVYVEDANTGSCVRMCLPSCVFCLALFYRHARIRHIELLA